VTAMQQIADWLKKVGMPEYAQRFAENGIEIDVLPELTDQDLEELGVSLGHRRRMLRAIRELSSTSATLPSTPLATEPIRQDVAERRQLTVMFCDLVGSTALSARLDPEDLRGIIGAYHRCCTELIERNGGFVARYMGDGVLAYFGYPRAHEHDAERAIQAGLALVEAAPKLTSPTGSPLQVRIGIATGSVVVGDLIGSGEAQERGIVGETPNLAARLQTLAEPDTVVIASSTRKLTGGLFEYRDLGAVSLKGFVSNVPAWQVLGASTAESRFEALRTATTPLVGREEEIDLLMRRWAQAKRGDGTVVLISGEPGIGKSRIAQEIAERLRDEPHTRLRYFCSPHHQDSALYPSIAQLERAAGFRRDDTREQRLDKLENVLSRVMDDLSEAVPLLADLLSIPVGGRYPSLNLTPQKRKERTLRAQLAQVEGLAAGAPVLMVFEDTHWSDPTTRESLDLLIDLVPTLRVLLIITFRPEFATTTWVGRPHVTLLSLNRLSPHQRAEMITHMIGGKALPQEIANQIVDRTDGVPLFIEELTKTVVESGILIEVGDCYEVKGSISPLAIPTSLHASLLARLDRLGPTREVAQIAAVIGRQFSHDLISAVAQMPKRQLDDAMEQLVRTELIFRRGSPPDAEYTFKHALLQDAAYSTLLRSRRQQLHGRIAATLETQFPEVVEARPEVMGRHCTEAGLREEAVNYWLKAGQQALARSAMKEAVAQLQKGLDQLALLPDSARHQHQELDLQVALGPALIATSGFAASNVGATYARARALAEQLDRPEYLVSLLYGEWAFHCIRPNHRLALSLAEQLERTGRARNDVTALLLGHFAHGTTCMFLGEFVTARALFEQCEGMSDPVRRSVYVAVTGTDQYLAMLSELGYILSCLGYLEQGRARISDALLSARRFGHANTLAYVLLYACMIDLLGGSARELAQHAEELIALSNEHGFALWLGWATILYGQSLIAVGKVEEGLVMQTNALSTIRATGAEIGIAPILCYRAAAYAKLGRLAEGLNLVAEAAQIIESANERYREAEIHRWQGDLLNDTGDEAAAEQSYHRALAVSRRQSAKLHELRAAASLGRLWRHQGKHTEARNLVAPIYRSFTEGFDTPVLRDAKALLDQLT